MKVTGQCHCGRITYQAVVDPATAKACHCTDCQRLTGSPYRVSIPAPKETFSLLTGQPRIYVKTAESGNKRAHAFCADCGAPVYSSALTDPSTYTLRVGCLTQRAQLPPTMQIWHGSSLAWAANLQGVPALERQ